MSLEPTPMRSMSARYPPVCRTGRGGRAPKFEPPGVLKWGSPPSPLRGLLKGELRRSKNKEKKSNGRRAEGENGGAEGVRRFQRLGGERPNPSKARKASPSGKKRKRKRFEPALRAYALTRAAQGRRSTKKEEIELRITPIMRMEAGMKTSPSVSSVYSAVESHRNVRPKNENKASSLFCVGRSSGWSGGAEVQLAEQQVDHGDEVGS